MKNLENFGVQELGSSNLKQINGGFWPYHDPYGAWLTIKSAGEAVVDAVVDAGQWVMGLGAGMSDGISTGLID